MDRNKPMLRSEKWDSVLTKAKNIKLLLLDVDGVLTDGTLIYSENGVEGKGFNTQDGFGLSLLKKTGVETGIITARSSALVKRRAEELGFTHIYQGYRNKVSAYEAILKKNDLHRLQTAYMGDDWLDLPLLAKVGLSAAPANGVAEVIQRVDYACSRSGGAGAVRELCELILAGRGELDGLLADYAG
jgi:3-deoxy-D-manno-octulosonate 8-phosphate phosphatase (KDO 8-P phosphatase)